jgi:hypothetical protein
MFKKIKDDKIKNEELDKNQLLRLMCANLEHARHVENERLTFTYIYIAIVLGFIAFIFNITPINEPSSNFIFNFIIIIISLISLFIISKISFELTKRWNDVFDGHMNKAEKIAFLIYGSEVEHETGMKYLMTMDRDEYEKWPYNKYYYFKNINNNGHSNNKGYNRGYRHTREFFEILYKILLSMICTFFVFYIIYMIIFIIKYT